MTEEKTTDSVVAKNLLDLTGARSIRSIALKTGLVIPTFTRQVREKSIPVEHLVLIARTYEVDPMDVLVAVEALEPGEARKYRKPRELGKFTTLELTGELHERAARAARSF